MQKELAELVQQNVKDSMLGMVTISDVEVTRDMSLAKIYVSFLGEKDTPKKCVKRLMEYVPALRHELCKRIRMRVMPELRFVHDESIERGMQMEKLLQGLKRDESDEP